LNHQLKLEAIHAPGPKERFFQKTSSAWGYETPTDLGFSPSLKIKAGLKPKTRRAIPSTS